jgi:hypothetical protein
VAAVLRHLAGMHRPSLLGLVLNCTVLWNTFYSNRTLEHLRAQGYPVRDEDAQRLAAFIRAHIGIDGHDAFHLPDLGGTHRKLRDPDSADRPHSPENAAPARDLLELDGRRDLGVTGQVRAGSVGPSQRCSAMWSACRSVVSGWGDAVAQAM